MKNAHQDKYNPAPDVASSSARATPARAVAPPASLAADEFYMEGSAMVFTAVYHLRCGFCCNSGCRHCPYRESNTAM